MLEIQNKGLKNSINNIHNKQFNKKQKFYFIKINFKNVVFFLKSILITIKNKKLFIFISKFIINKIGIKLYKNDFIKKFIPNFPFFDVLKNIYIQNYFKILIKPAMTSEEIEELKKYLKRDDLMLEWGSGGSTLFFSKYVKEYHSIEHDYEWYSNIKKIIRSNPNLYKKVNIYHVKQNFEKSNLEQYNFKDYVNFVDQLGIKEFQKVLIDGRDRISCAIKILKYISKDSIVFIHDYSIRPYYSKVLKYYNIIDLLNKNPGLIILSPKLEFIEN